MYRSILLYGTMCSSVAQSASICRLDSALEQEYEHEYAIARGTHKGSCNVGASLFAVLVWVPVRAEPEQQ